MGPRPISAPGLRKHWPLALLAAMVVGYFVPQLATGTVQFDGVDVHYAPQRYFSDAIRAGHLPFWTPYMFTGFPFLADLQVGAWYPLNWPFFVAGIVPASISGELLLHTLIAGGGTYALAMRLLGRPFAAVAAAVFYALSGWFAAHSQHVGMVETAAWLPWLVLLAHQFGERLSAKRLASGALLGAALALPGHFQVALYAFSGVAVWAALEAVWRRSRDSARRSGIGMLAVAIGGGLLSAVMVLPALELVSQSVRSQLNARDSDIGYFQLDSLLTLVQPDYFGLLSGPYTGPGDSTQHYFYAGILLVPLAVLGALRHPRVLRLALFLGVPFVWYAAGPDAGLFKVVARLPGFRSIELPMHGWFLPALGLALLGGAGFAVLDARLRLRPLAPLLLIVMGGDALLFNQLMDPLAFARQSFDVLYSQPLQAFALELAAQSPPVRRLYGPELTSIGYRNHALQSRVETTYGYNPLELLAYADYASAAEGNPRLIDGLAASHRLIDDQAASHPLGDDLAASHPLGDDLAASHPLGDDLAASHPLGDDLAIQPNPTALPLAYFARQVISVTDDLAPLADLDPAQDTLVVGAALAVQPDPSATVEVVERAEDHLTLRYQSSSAGLLRVAVPFYPGWHASLNATDLPLLTVDHAFIGIVVPAGQGQVLLQYTPRFFWLGVAISAIALLATLAALLFRSKHFGHLWRRRFR